MSDTRKHRSNITRGLLHLARFDRRFLADFGHGPEHVLGALAPLGGFAIAGSLLMAARGKPLDGLANLFEAICLLLTPLVASHMLARRWQREPDWFGYGTVVTWCQWIYVMAFALGLVAANVALRAGVPEAIAGNGLMGALLFYGAALQLFIGRVALRIDWGRAVMLVVVVNTFTALATFSPEWISEAVAPQAAPSAHHAPAPKPGSGQPDTGKPDARKAAPAPKHS